MTTIGDNGRPWASEEELEAGLRDLLAGPSPVNRVVGAIELDQGGRDGPRPSRAIIDAARAEMLRGLWGF